MSYVSCHESVNNDVNKKVPKIYGREERKWLFYESLVYKMQSLNNNKQNLRKCYKGKYALNTKIERVKNRKRKSEALSIRRAKNDLLPELYIIVTGIIL